MRVWITIEEAGGPGLELANDRSRPGPVITGGRSGGTFLGLDRGAVFETDTGDGTPLAAVVALPASSAPGCWVEAEVAGVLTDGDGAGRRSVLVTVLPGQELPIAPLVRVAARMPHGELRDAAYAADLVRHANERFRRRRAAGRRPLRPAWLPMDVETREVTGASIASAAERDLTRLPPRFVRGLTGLLDPDERILAIIERPPEPAGGLLAWRRQRDRRAALLLLTDRQVLWLVDHVPPSRYLLDWGVDAELIPLERLHSVRHRFGTATRSTPGGLLVQTDAGETAFPLPDDLEPEARAFAQVLARFLPEPGVDATAILRRYPIEPAAFDPEPAGRFRQGDEAMARINALGDLAGQPVLAAFYAPRRERVKRSVAVAVTAHEVLVDAAGPPIRIPLPALRVITLALSPLVGRVELHAGRQPVTFTYPAPIAEHATAFIRICRRAWANATGAPLADASRARAGNASAPGGAPR